jgi:hypothetical protein
MYLLFRKSVIDDLHKPLQRKLDRDIFLALDRKQLLMQLGQT